MKSNFRSLHLSVMITLFFSVGFFFFVEAQTAPPASDAPSATPGVNSSQGGTKTSYENVNPSQEDILKRIENYKAPAYPGGGKETYEYRIESQTPNPPTLTDAFMCDMYQRITMDLKITSITPSQVSEENILNAFDIYLNRDWVDIAGYRPWTYYNFIRNLNDSERLKLAKQTVAYMKKNGVKDPTFK